MTSEVFTFFQTQVQPQTQQVNNSAAVDEQSQPGLFDSLITEYSSDCGEDISINQQAVTEIQEVPEHSQVITFNGTNIFSGSVLEILADNNEDQPEIFSDMTAKAESLLTEGMSTLENIFADLKSSVSDAISKLKVFVSENLDVDSLNADVQEILSGIINNEDFSEKFALLPQEVQHEIKQALDEFAQALQNPAEDLSGSTQRLLSVLAKTVTKPEFRVAIPESEREKISAGNDDDVDDNPENLNMAANLTGAAVVQNNTPEIEDIPAKSEAKPEFDNSREVKQIHQDPSNTEQVNGVKDKNVSTSTKPESANRDTTPEEFRELLEKRINEREKSDNDTNNSGNNFNQSRENYTSTRNSSRSRNSSNDRRAANESTRSQNERAYTSSTLSRNDARNDFQQFFEGVLSSRRTFSQSSTTPLNLRANYNFTQSETLRNGLVNVVRFIRADGVHRANVIIDPPALGRISVELTSGTSGVEASIKVASEQIRQLVQDQISQLRMNLSQQGVQVAEFTVDVQQDNQQQQGNSSQNNNQNNRRGIISEVDEEPEEFRVDLEEGLLYWVA